VSGEWAAGPVHESNAWSRGPFLHKARRRPAGSGGNCNPSSEAADPVRNGNISKRGVFLFKTRRETSGQVMFELQRASAE
jgi:hypothetical protein